MADVLTQAQIDALLNSLNEDGDLDTEVETEPELKVSNYDFRTAHRFSKDQIKTLNIIYDYFSRIFSNHLSGMLRTMCDVSVGSVEELKYQEFVNSLPNSVMLAVMNMPPLDGPTLLELSPDMCYTMIGRLLGGSNAVRVQSSLESNRSYTEIELVLLERVLRQFANLINEAWQKVTHVEASLDRIETNPMFAQIVSLNETVALVTLNCKIGDVSGFINFCLPHLALEPINKQLTTKAWYQSSGAERKSLPPATGNISHRINTTRLPLSVVFNETVTTTGDVLSLQPDDVIVLDHRVEQPLTLKIGHLSKFRVEVGSQDKMYAAKIIAPIQEEDNNNG